MLSLKKNKKLILLCTAIVIAVIILLLSPFKMIDGKLYNVNTKELELRHCTLSKYDIKKLSKFRKVHVLKLAFCDADSIAFIESMPELRELYINGNSLEDGKNIRDLTAISRCSKLKEIHMLDVGLTELSLFKNLPELENLDIPFNYIEDISDISSLKNLKEICIWGDDISDLSEFSALHELKYANIRSNNLYDITSLTEIESLECIIISSFGSSYKANGYIKIPDLSDCKNLKDIRLISGSDADYSMLLSAPALEKICVVSGRLSDKQRAEFVMRGIKIDEVGEVTYPPKNSPSYPKKSK